MVKKTCARSLGKNWAAVMVKKIAPHKFQIMIGEVCILPAYQMVCEQPENQIVDEEGNEIRAEGKFLWTADTIDPYHFVADVY